MTSSTSPVDPMPIASGRLMTRAQTAQALTDAGYPIARKTLDVMACRGGGPPYRKFGPHALYNWGEALAWAAAKTGAPAATAAEHRLSKQPA